MEMAHASDKQFAAFLVPPFAFLAAMLTPMLAAPDRGSDRGAVGSRILPVRHP